MQRSSGLRAVSIAFALATVAAGAAAWLVALGERVGAGAALALAGIALLWAARVPGVRRAPRTSFASSLAERAAETAPLAALAWTLLPSRAGIAAVVALAAAFVSSYLQVKGIGLGFSTSERPALLPLRMASVALGLLTGWVEAGLWVSGAIAVAAAAAASAEVAGQEEPA